MRVFLDPYIKQEKRFILWCLEVIKKINEAPPSIRPPVDPKKEKELREQIEKTKAQLDLLKASLAELDK